MLNRCSGKKYQPRVGGIWKIVDIGLGGKREWVFI